MNINQKSKVRVNPRVRWMLEYVSRKRESTPQQSVSREIPRVAKRDNEDAKLRDKKKGVRVHEQANKIPKIHQKTIKNCLKNNPKNTKMGRRRAGGGRLRGGNPVFVFLGLFLTIFDCFLVLFGCFLGPRPPFY